MNLSFSRIIIFSILLFVLGGCGLQKKKSTSPKAKHSIENLLANYVDIVLASYEDSLLSAKMMRKSVTNFTASPSEKTLSEARKSWIQARFPYLQTEVYRFYGGPIDDENGPEGLLNAWPLDEAYVDYVRDNIQSGIINNPKDYPNITKETLANLNEKHGEENISCGFHAIEFLLWGQDLNKNGPGNRPHTDYTTRPNAERRKQFLLSATDLLIENLESLVMEWLPDAVNFRAKFLAKEPKDALEKIITGMTLLSGFELAGERLLVAYESRAQEDEHSCFSDTTHNDIKYDLAGLLNIWRGQYIRIDGSRVDGTGVRDFTKNKDPKTTKKIDGLFDLAIIQSEAIPVPFDKALLADENSPPRKAIIDLIESLEEISDGLAGVAENHGIKVPREVTE
jgi:putative iron-regulated protein